MLEFGGHCKPGGNYATSSNPELTTVYNNRAVTTDFQDTTKGF